MCSAAFWETRLRVGALATGRFDDASRSKNGMFGLYKGTSSMCCNCQ
jgi:hypothetical protein